MGRRDPSGPRWSAPWSKGMSARDAVDAEIEHYLEERTAQLVAEGWQERAARTEAERRFGSRRRYGATLTKLEAKRRRKTMTTATLDFVRDATAATLRTLKRSPGLALAVVLTMALGVGANVAMFGILDRLLLRPPDGITRPDALRRVAITTQGDSGPPPQFALTYPDVQDLREHRGLVGVAAFEHGREVTVGSGPDAESVRARLVSHDFFDVLGVRAEIGRFPTAEEDEPGVPGTVVLSWSYWQGRFGGDRGVLGSSLEIGGEPYVVVGVTPRGVTGISLTPTDLWMPIETAFSALGGRQGWQDERRSWWVQAVVRIENEADWPATAAEADAIYRAAGGDAWVGARRAEDRRTFTFEPISTVIDANEAHIVKWLVGVSIVVLLIACANVANLFLARAARRRKDVAVRLALGVSRPRLVGEMALEAVILASLGGLVALALAGWGAEALRRVLLPDVLMDPLGPRVLGFTAVVSMLAGLVAGVGPAIRATRVDPDRSIRAGVQGSSGQHRRLLGGLVVAQTGMTVLLLVGAGLFVKSLGTLRAMDLGLEVDRLLLVRLETTGADLDVRESIDLHRRAAEVARRVVGVESVGLTVAPLGWGFYSRLRVPGVDSLPPMPGGGPYYWTVDEEYFRTTGIEVLEGRAFEPTDDEHGERVAVVSATMADSLWHGNALGQCLIVGAGAPDGDPPCTTVVGVVPDVARQGFLDEPYFGYYLPLSQRPTEDRVAGLYVRTLGATSPVAAEVASALRTEVSGVRFARVESLRSRLDPQARTWDLGATLFSLFGGLALAVAAIGLYSLLTFNVAERTRELGIRIALGADRRRLLRQVMGDASRLAVAGALGGLLTAWLLAPRVGELLFGVAPHDAAVFATVALLLAAVTLLASLVPARRATRVDPIDALRTE